MWPCFSERCFCCPAAGFHHYRHWILFLSIASISVNYAGTIAFNFTILCMQHPEQQQGSGGTGERGGEGGGGDGNQSSNFSSHMGDSSILSTPTTYSSLETSLLFAGTSIGCLLAGPLVTVLVAMLGLKRSYLTVGWVCITATLLLPLSAELGFLPLLLIRILQGSGGSLAIPLMGSITKEWAPTISEGTYLVLLSSSFQLGPMLAMPVASVLCTSSNFGWPYVYYLWGAVGIAIQLLFHLFYWERPDAKQSLASDKEVAIIREGRSPKPHPEAPKSFENRERRFDEEKTTTTVTTVPYRAIFTDPVVWVTMLALFAEELGFFAMVHYGPTYLNQTVGLSMAHTGVAAALPYAVSMATKFIAGPLNDRLIVGFISSAETRTKMWAMVSALGSTTCFLLLALLPTLLPRLVNLAAPPHWLMQGVFSTINVFTSLTWLGLRKSPIMIAGEFSHVLMTWEVMVTSSAMLLSPIVVGAFAPSYTAQEWSRVFIGFSVLQLLGIGAFAALCDSKPRKWALVGLSPHSSNYANNREEVMVEGGGGVGNVTLVGVRRNRQSIQY